MVLAFVYDDDDDCFFPFLSSSFLTALPNVEEEVFFVHFVFACMYDVIN